MFDCLLDVFSSSRLPRRWVGGWDEGRLRLRLLSSGVTIIVHDGRDHRCWESESGRGRQWQGDDSVALVVVEV